MEGDNESTPLLSDRTMGRSLSEGATRALRFVCLAQGATRP